MYSFYLFNQVCFIVEIMA